MINPLIWITGVGLDCVPGVSAEGDAAVDASEDGLTEVNGGKVVMGDGSGDSSRPGEPLRVETFR